MGEAAYSAEMPSNLVGWTGPGYLHPASAAIAHNIPPFFMIQTVEMGTL